MSQLSATTQLPDDALAKAVAEAKARALTLLQAAGPAGGIPISNGTPPNSIPTSMPSVQIVNERIYIDQAMCSDVAFNIRSRLLGKGCAFIKHIAGTSGCSVQLRGRTPAASSTDACDIVTDEPLHFQIFASNSQACLKAVAAINDLLSTVKRAFDTHVSAVRARQLEAAAAAAASQQHLDGQRWPTGAMPTPPTPLAVVAATLPPPSHPIQFPAGSYGSGYPYGAPQLPHLGPHPMPMQTQHTMPSQQLAGQAPGHRQQQHQKQYGYPNCSSAAPAPAPITQVFTVPGLAIPSSQRGGNGSGGLVLPPGYSGSFTVPTYANIGSTYGQVPVLLSRQQQKQQQQQQGGSAEQARAQPAVSTALVDAMEDRKGAAVPPPAGLYTCDEGDDADGNGGDGGRSGGFSRGQLGASSSAATQSFAARLLQRAAANGTGAGTGGHSQHGGYSKPSSAAAAVAGHGGGDEDYDPFAAAEERLGDQQHSSTVKLAPPDESDDYDPFSAADEMMGGEQQPSAAPLGQSSSLWLKVDASHGDAYVDQEEDDYYSYRQHAPDASVPEAGYADRYYHDMGAGYRDEDGVQQVGGLGLGTAAACDDHDAYASSASSSAGVGRSSSAAKPGLSFVSSGTYKFEEGVATALAGGAPSSSSSSSADPSAGWASFGALAPTTLSAGRQMEHPHADKRFKPG